MRELVTGDAVVLELRLARLPSRAIAFGIDLAVMLTAFLLVVAITAGALGGLDDALAAALVLVLTLAVFIGYPVTLEALTRGRSVGKLAMGLRVVRDDGGPVRFRHALTRGLAGFIVDFGVFSLFTGAVALIASLSSARGQRVGDLLAGTVVLREREPVQRAAVVETPRSLAGWAGSVEISRLPDDLALAARQFLLRAGQLDPPVRVRIADRLAAEIAGHVSPPPPPGTPAEAYLAAVLAERRRRESARLAAPESGGGWAVPSATPSGPSATPSGPPATPSGGGFAPPVHPAGPTPPPGGFVPPS